MLGAPAGKVTAERLGATCWISAHDGDKDIKGLATVLLKTRRWGRGEEWVETDTHEKDDIKFSGGSGVGGWVFNIAGARDREKVVADFASVKSGISSGAARSRGGGKGTDVIELGSGEQVVLTSEGVWNVDRVNELYKARATEVKEMGFPAVGEIMDAGVKI